ncbi:MAG: helix-turn-helix domain-containing protein [Myxococcales bacterium]|nr:helix-turn-helix domain-containing protein [Myxococcales bacterium]
MLLSTVKAAELLGVKPSTIKRWSDQGLLRSLRTPGGHRRFDRQDVLLFAARQTRPASAGVSLQSLLDWLLTGRRQEVDAFLLSSRSRLGAWFRVADEVGSLLTETGDRWSSGDLSIAQEHLLSDGFSRAIGRMTQSIPLPSHPPLAALASVEGDTHTLGLSLAELCLVEGGYQTLWLGASTPASEVASLLDRSPVRLVALSASAISNQPQRMLEIASQIGAACQRHQIDLVLGGNGAWPEPPPFGARLHSFSDLHAHLSTLAKGAPI